MEEFLYKEDKCPYKRQCVGHILFMAGSRFRAFDASRIPNEPHLESENENGLVKVETLSHLTKNGQRPERRGRVLQVVATAVWITGRPWAKKWLQLRKELGLEAQKWGCLQPNIDGDWRPIVNSTMPSTKVTEIVRNFLKVEMPEARFPEEVLTK